jgi:hypothetical protein
VAELLVKASPHWMDKLTQEDVDKMSVSEKQSYDARSQKGDIIVVSPDDWQWGDEECLPRFEVVKKDIPFDKAKELERSDYERYLSPAVTIQDFKTKEQIKQITEVATKDIPPIYKDMPATEEVAINILRNKAISDAVKLEVDNFKATITKMEVVNETKNETIQLAWEDKYLFKTREQLFNDKVSFKVTADKEYICSPRIENKLCGVRRYCVKDGVVIDKVTNKEVEF